MGSISLIPQTLTNDDQDTGGRHSKGALGKGRKVRSDRLRSPVVVAGDHCKAALVWKLTNSMRSV